MDITRKDHIKPKLKKSVGEVKLPLKKLQSATTLSAKKATLEHGNVKLQSSQSLTAMKTTADEKRTSTLGTSDPPLPRYMWPTTSSIIRNSSKTSLKKADDKMVTNYSILKKREPEKKICIPSTSTQHTKTTCKSGPLKAFPLFLKGIKNTIGLKRPFAPMKPKDVVPKLADVSDTKTTTVEDGTDKAVVVPVCGNNAAEKYKEVESLEVSIKSESVITTSHFESASAVPKEDVVQGLVDETEVDKENKEPVSTPLGLVVSDNSKDLKFDYEDKLYEFQEPQSYLPRISSPASTLETTGSRTSQENTLSDIESLASGDQSVYYTPTAGIGQSGQNTFTPWTVLCKQFKKLDIHETSETQTSESENSTNSTPTPTTQ